MESSSEQPKRPRGWNAESRLKAAKSNRARSLDRALDVVKVAETTLSRKEKAAALGVSVPSLNMTVMRAYKRIEQELATKPVDES